MLAVLLEHVIIYSVMKGLIFLLHIKTYSHE